MIKNTVRRHIRFLFMATFCLLIITSLFAEVRVSIDQPSYLLNYENDATVSVNIEGMTEPLRGFEMSLSFDTDYLAVSGLEAFEEGSFLSDNGETQWYVIGENGNYRITCAILGVSPGSNGSGTLFTVDFSSLTSSTGLAGTDIVLSDVIMRDVLNNGITIDVIENCNIIVTGLTYVIPLFSGWNTISSPVIPLNPDMEAVFSQLISDGYLVKIQDEAGNAIVQNTVGEWLQEINEFEMDEGYFVNVNADCTLSLSGDLVTLPLTIQLQPGWNIISYPYLTPQNAMTFLQPLIDSNQLVKVRDESGSTIMENTFGVWVNNIGNFEAGEGYYISVNTDTQIIYPAP